MGTSPKGLSPDGLCGSCRTKSGTRRAPAFDSLFTMVEYRAPFDDVLQAYKFAGRDYLAEPLSRWCADHLRDELRALGGLDAVVPLPLSLRRRWQRGYNQSALLAEHLAERLGVPRRALLARAHRAPQSSLPLAERRHNIRGAFALRAPSRGLRLLLVDDVVTSGATLGEAARCLKRGGATAVHALALARTPE